MRADEPSEFLTAADLCQRYRCSRMWITRHIKQYHFPKPIKFGGRVGSVRRWRRADVERWEQSWIEQTNNELARAV
jgi:predicted DNA-binding transcriptional regulator AlpA